MKQKVMKTILALGIGASMASIVPPPNLCAQTPAPATKEGITIVSTTPMTNRDIYPEGTVKITYRSAIDNKTDWALYTPGDLSRNTVVYMHGSFSHADQIYKRRDVRNFWLTRILEGKHPLLSVNLRDTTYMSPATTEDFTHLLDYCSKKYNTKNYVLLGGSGGASSALAYTVIHSEKLYGTIALGTCDLLARMDFARKSSIPVLKRLAETVFKAYGGSLEERPELYEARSIILNPTKVNIPLIVAIGEKDSYIPVVEARKISAVMGHNPNYQYIEVPNGNHDSSLWIDIDLQTLKVSPSKKAALATEAEIDSA